MKTCTKCKQTKHYSEYTTNRRTRDGLQPSCKACCREYNKSYTKRPDVRARASQKQRERYATDENFRAKCLANNKILNERYKTRYNAGKYTVYSITYGPLEYIGYTKMELTTRLYVHIAAAKEGKYKRSQLHQMIRDGKLTIKELKECAEIVEEFDTKGEAMALEARLINANLNKLTNVNRSLAEVK